MRKLRDETAMTLTELLFAMAISVIIFGAAVTTFVEFLDVSTRSDNQTQAQETARSTVDRLAAQMRNAMSTGSTSTSPIESFSDFDLIFLAPLPGATTTSTNPRGLYHVRYCLGNANNKNDVLWYQTTAFDSSTQSSPPATTSCPSNAWTTKTAVADHLVNRSVQGIPVLFQRMCSHSGVIQPCISGDLLSDTLRVRVDAWVDWNANKDPAATELTTIVNLRNVNRAPTAATTCTGLANGHIQCDASGSYDPDGQTINYAWALDGTTLAGQNAYRLDQTGFASKSAHTIVLTVTDPGGAVGTVTKTVTMP